MEKARERRNAARIWRHTHLHMEEEMVIPWFAPIAKVIRGAYKKGKRAAAMSVRACMGGGWWVQRRVYAHRTVASEACKCGEAAGTLWHKFGVCQLAQEEREAFGKSELFKWGKGALFDPLFSRGVPARPELPRTPKPCEWRTECIEGEAM